MASEDHTNEIDLVVKYANEKGGSTDGQLIIDSVELERSRDNRVRHGIGNEEPQEIEKGNKTYTFSTTTYMNSAAARALERIFDGAAETQAVYVVDNEAPWKEKASGMVFNSLTTSASDDGDTTVDIDADLLGLEFSQA
jgi:hypothetical protein